ncbi:MAG: NYN domain-containing protein, partial [Bacillota bacterium]|nr:NYN domain-containing protein [Bacillota bacterium]
IIKSLIKTRKVFPCFFGSALKLEGVDEFLAAIDNYTLPIVDMNDFGARVYKITRDQNGNRLSHIKVTSGKVKVRDIINDEKITQIRSYNGNKFDTVDEAVCGNTYALLGLDKTFAGEGLGKEKNSEEAMLIPVLTYSIHIVDGTDSTVAFQKISVLTEEDPSLRIIWNQNAKEIQAQLMGRIQVEVLEELILDRFGIDVSIETGKIIYRETIEEPIEGVGHFEPLKHYAEVHLLMEPLPAGSGIVLESACSTDVLDLNWQRLILTNLAEKKHIGVLTGSPITDMRITVVAGRAHLKHTEGGDFRQATYRAVRQGLRKAKNVLLEPFFDFTLEVPSTSIGRAISDIKSMGCTFDSPVEYGEYMSINGVGPASELSNYQTILLSYTKGEGKLSCRYKGYYPCHNTEKVINEIAYDVDRDIENSADSVFCSHGSGINVPWYKVEDFMHIDSGIRIEGDVPALTTPKVKTGNIDFDEKELEAIMLKEFGPIKRPQYSKVTYDSDEYRKKHIDIKKEYLIVDGYNVIYAWDNLKELSSVSLEAAALTLSDVLENYAHFRNCNVTIVFDAYKVKQGTGSKSSSDLVNILYTKEGESADFYIEKLIREI